MKFRKSRPLIAASIGRMIALSIPKRPDASPERKTVAASTHSSAATLPPSTLAGQAASYAGASDYDRAMSAVEAAVAVAEAHGVMCEQPIVLRGAWHVLVHLWPAPVVARVTSGAPGVNPDDVEQELRVALHAARAGAPVVQPSDLLPPGPHRHDGQTLVFWRYLEQDGTLDAPAAGRGLRALHDSLADYEGELPRAGRADEVREMLEPFAPSDDVELLYELAARELPEGQALHGDGHLFNCIQTQAGPIWHDLETACRGPREYDLAALVLEDQIGRAHV